MNWGEWTLLISVIAAVGYLIVDDMCKGTER